MNFSVATLLFILLRLQISFCESLLVNTLNELELLVRERIQLKIAVVKSCPSFELFVGSDDDEFTRLSLHLNFKGLRKLDVDTPDSIPPSSKLLYNFECDNAETTLLNVTIDLIDDSKYIVFTDKSQRFTRPKNSGDPQFSLFLHHVQPCCVTKFELELFSQQRNAKSIVLNRLPPSVPLTTAPEPSSEEVIPAQRAADSSLPCAKEQTSSAKFVAWTSEVNEEWITSFVVIATIITSFMVISVFFGIALCIYLLMPPSDYMEEKLTRK